MLYSNLAFGGRADKTNKPGKPHAKSREETSFVINSGDSPGGVTDTQNNNDTDVQTGKDCSECKLLNRFISFASNNYCNQARAAAGSCIALVYFFLSGNMTFSHTSRHPILPIMFSESSMYNKCTANEDTNQFAVYQVVVEICPSGFVHSSYLPSDWLTLVWTHLLPQILK